MGMQNGSQGNVPQIRRRIVVADYAIRKQSEWMWVVSVKFARSLNAEAATAVGVVYEDELAAVGVGFFNRRELSWFGAEGFFIGISEHSEQGRAECQRGEKKDGLHPDHSDITLLLSPK